MRGRSRAGTLKPSLPRSWRGGGSKRSTLRADMGKQKIEIRVILFDGEKYAVYFRVSVNGYDIYTGSGSMNANEVFKGSYHSSGQRHLKVLEKMVSKGQLPRPEEVSEPVQVAASSQSIQNLNWGYKIKRETKSRKNLVMDLRGMLDVPSFTAELWALPASEERIAEAVLKRYKGKGRLLAKLLISSVKPTFLLFVWTLKPEGWAALRRSASSS